MFSCHQNGMAKKKVQDQGKRILRIEAFIRYASMTKDESQRRYGAFYEAIKKEIRHEAFGWKKGFNFRSCQ